MTETEHDHDHLDALWRRARQAFLVWLVQPTRANRRRHEQLSDAYLQAWTAAQQGSDEG